MGSVTEYKSELSQNESNFKTVLGTRGNAHQNTHSGSFQKPYSLNNSLIVT